MAMLGEGKGHNQLRENLWEPQSVSSSEKKMLVGQLKDTETLISLLLIYCRLSPRFQSAYSNFMHDNNNIVFCVS